VIPQLLLFYSCEDHLSDQEADDELTSLLSGSPPPLGSISNPVVVSNDEDDIESLLSRPNHREARLFSTPI
jgi:hypothetical protein